MFVVSLKSGTRFELIDRIISYKAQIVCLFHGTQNLFERKRGVNYIFHKSWNVCKYCCVNGEYNFNCNTPNKFAFHKTKKCIFLNSENNNEPVDKKR